MYICVCVYIYIYRHTHTHTIFHFCSQYPFLTPGKHQKTLRFSDVFKGYRKGALGTNGYSKVPYNRGGAGIVGGGWKL